MRDDDSWQEVPSKRRARKAKEEAVATAVPAGATAPAPATAHQPPQQQPSAAAPLKATSRADAPHAALSGRPAADGAAPTPNAAGKAKTKADKPALEGKAAVA